MTLLADIPSYTSEAARLFVGEKGLRNLAGTTPRYIIRSDGKTSVQFPAGVQSLVDIQINPVTGRLSVEVEVNRSGATTNAAEILQARGSAKNWAVIFDATGNLVIQNAAGSTIQVVASANVPTGPFRVVVDWNAGVVTCTVYPDLNLASASIGSANRTQTFVETTTFRFGWSHSLGGGAGVTWTLGAFRIATDTADFTTRTAVTDISWQSVGVGIVAERSSTKAYQGTSSLKISRPTGTALSQARLLPDQRATVTPNTQVTVRAEGSNESSGRNGAIGIEWYDSAGSLLSTSWGSTVALSSTEWRSVTVTATAPANTVRFGVILGLAPGQASSSQAFFFDRVNAYTGDNPDIQFTEWYLDSLTKYMQWQISQLRNVIGYTKDIHMLHPSFGLRTNMAFGAANYQQQAAEGVDWARQVPAYNDAKVWPQATWGNQTPPWDPENDENYVNDTDKPSWYKLWEIATANNKLAKLACENTGGSSPNWDNNASIDYMFGPRGAMAPGRFKGLTWLNWPRLKGEVAGTHATAAYLSSKIKP